MEEAPEPSNVAPEPSNVQVKAEQDEKIYITPSPPQPEQKSLANAPLVGNANVPKTRVVILELADQVSSEQAEIKERIILLMSERCSDRMVEAFMQFQYWDSCPYDSIPIMPTAYHADRYAAQLCALMKKDGYKVIKDDVMGHSAVPDYLADHGYRKRSSYPSYMPL